MTQPNNNEQARVAVVQIATPEQTVLAVEVAVNGAALTIDQGTTANDERLTQLALELISYILEHYDNG